VNIDGIAAELRPRFKGRIETGFPLARLTTYRLGGPAALYAEPLDIGDIETLGAALSEHVAPGEVPVLALGRGSNLLISDDGFPGVAVRLGPAFASIREADGDGDVVAGAAASLPQAANWATRRGLAGLEWAIAIPGSVGGGVRMNAGAHGGQISDRLVDVAVFHLSRLVVERRAAGELDLAYRRSNLTERDLVLEARFGLHPADVAEVRARMEEYRHHRATTQPGALQNAGSTFKNPPGDSAGRLVEAAGLKGFAVRGASVSDLHANFFIARDGATAQDVHDLIMSVRSRVRERFGVDLEPEVRFVGRFEEGALQ